jgi:iron uptake system component EfeO
MKHLALALALGLALASLALSACGSDPDAKSDDARESEVATAMHDALLVGIRDLRQATLAIQAAAPTAPRGWDAQADAASLAAMRDAWVLARAAYERIEGAIAPLFPGIDASIDARYDDVLAARNGKADDDLFDGEGVTGLHAIERILYIDTTPAHVVDFEKTLPGYLPAALPATAAESDDFRTRLCAKLVDDVATLEAQWAPAQVDIGGAFQGLVSLMNEQREKVNKASTLEEESRYSQRTMADIRDNLAGTEAIYELFAPWLVTRTSADATKDGPGTDARIRAGFRALQAAYAAVPGAAIPEPPASWSAEHPSTDDMQTPFGALYGAVEAAVDPGNDASVVEAMNDAAGILGFPLFVEVP